MIGIFQEKNINRVLAFIITFLTLPIGWFIKMVWALFAFMGIWSVAVFAATFIAGVFFRGAGAATKEYVSFEEVAGMAKKQRKELSRDLEKIKGETVAVMNPVIDAAIQAAAALGLSQSVVNTLKAARISNDPNQKRKYVEAAAKMIERGL
jgi:ABC-type multidrug transport system fused ATPase/permease subunit